MGNRPNISIKCWGGKDGEVIGQVSGGRDGLRNLPSLGVRDSCLNGVSLRWKMGGGWQSSAWVAQVWAPRDGRVFMFTHFKQ